MKKGLVVGIAAIAIIALTLGIRSSNKKAIAEEKITTINVAHTQNYVPYDYINDKGESDGFEVQVLKAIDKKLPQYKLKFTGTSDDDLLIGLESGKYDLGVKGAWYTKERAEKFIIPKEKIGASIIGFTVRKTDEQKYQSIDDIAKFGGKLVPISPQNAQWNVIEEYNKEHTEHPIQLKAAEAFNVSDAYAWVLEKRYDAYFDIKLSFEEAVRNEKGSYHQYADQLSYVPYKGIPTFPLLHRNDKNEKFSVAYDKAVKELESDGTLIELSKKYFGEDVFKFIQE
ncbi:MULTISPECIES: transporter substrate-binding domain-containing protein [Enterococcus]|uniref:transporter substrate-binding domain-containing protein n=1 Tax=Enterococcus TaxID=1350 RepID=UPI000EDDD1BE|nr:MULTISPECIES: transporter substrate-binding domain-containing protein [Enterococcus]HCM87626.1 amino acid ABC transporter substrate-binding protein [Enterococcus sp.]